VTCLMCEVCEINSKVFYLSRHFSLGGVGEGERGGGSS